MRKIITILGLFALQATADKFNFWCGKPYNATAPHFAGYNMGWPDGSYDLPHGQDYHSIKVVQGRLPYLNTDTEYTAVAYVPRSAFDMTQQMNITVSIPKLNASKTIAPSQAFNGVSFPIDGSVIGEGRSQFAADITYTQSENFTMFQAYLDTVVMDVYKAPEPATNTSVVALDTLTQTISVNGCKRFIPIGYYVSTGAMFAGDFSDVDKFVAQYASEGYNTMMHAGSITSNSTQMDWTLRLCEKYGLYYQADVVGIAGNITALAEFIDRWTKYPSFLSYYIGNEPDGNLGVGSLEPAQSKYAHDFLKFNDPYHPVTLVTNCAHTMPMFAGNTDFVMNDVYSVGIPDHFQGFVCNETQGDCGCDLCDSTNAVRAVADRFDGFYEDLGINYPAITFVEQTFYSDAAYWSRPPTYAEEFAMAWLSIVSGASGVLGYTYPVTGVPMEYSELKHAIADFAANMSSESTLAQNTVLSGARVHYGRQQNVYYASWLSGYIIAVSADYKNSSPLALFTSDLDISSETSKFSAQALGRQTTGKGTRQVHVKDGLLVDSVAPLSVVVYAPST